MSFAEDIAADLALIFSSSEAGEAVQYAPKGGLARDINAIVSYGQDLENANWGAALEAAATAWVREIDIPAPEAGDALTVSGKTWTVVRKLSRQAGLWKLQLTSDIRPAFGRRSNA